MSSSRRMIVTLLAAVLLVGVGAAIAFFAMRDNPANVVLADGTRLKDMAASQAALPTCAQVFVAGDTIDAAKGRAGCRDAQGAIQVEAYHSCKDGRILFTVDAPRGWGFGGDTFHQTITPVAEDPAFSTAYHACVS